MKEKFDKRRIGYNGYVIAPDHFDTSLEYFIKLGTEAKTDFPNLTDSDIQCFVVTDSDYIRGFAAVRFKMTDYSPKYAEHIKL